MDIVTLSSSHLQLFQLPSSTNQIKPFHSISSNENFSFSNFDWLDGNSNILLCSHSPCGAIYSYNLNNFTSYELIPATFQPSRTKFCVHPNGRHVLSGDSNGGIQLYKIKDNENVKLKMNYQLSSSSTSTTTLSSSSAVVDLTIFHNENSLFASCLASGLIYVADLYSERFRCVFNKDGNLQPAVSICSSGAAVCDSNSLCGTTTAALLSSAHPLNECVALWDVSKGCQLHTINKLSQVNYVRFSPINDHLIVCCSQNGNVTLLDSHDAKILHQIPMSSPAFAVDFYQNGHFIVVASNANVSRVFDLRYLPSPLYTLHGPGKENVKSIAFRPNHSDSMNINNKSELSDFSVRTTYDTEFASPQITNSRKDRYSTGLSFVSFALSEPSELMNDLTLGEETVLLGNNGVVGGGGLKLHNEFVSNDGDNKENQPITPSDGKSHIVEFENKKPTGVSSATATSSSSLSSSMSVPLSLVNEIIDEKLNKFCKDILSDMLDSKFEHMRQALSYDVIKQLWMTENNMKALLQEHFEKEKQLKEEIVKLKRENAFFKMSN